MLEAPYSAIQLAAISSGEVDKNSSGVDYSGESHNLGYNKHAYLSVILYSLLHSWSRSLTMNFYYVKYIFTSVSLV